MGQYLPSAQGSWCMNGLVCSIWASNWLDHEPLLNNNKNTHPSVSFMLQLLCELWSVLCDIFNLFITEFLTMSRVKICYLHQSIFLSAQSLLRAIRSSLLCGPTFITHSLCAHRMHKTMGGWDPNVTDCHFSWAVASSFYSTCLLGIPFFNLIYW